MKHYKTIENGEVYIGGSDGEIPEGATEITEAEANDLFAAIQEKAQVIRNYRDKVNAGKIALTDVPQEYMDKVKAIVKQEHRITNAYNVQDNIYDRIIDDYTMELIDGGILE